MSRERALLSNARCLAEGVDVPTLDGVAFIDPRRSEIDIVQAVGRAIRLAPDKELGTIVLPVFIDSEGDAEEVLDQSVFKPIWDVVKALRSHDEELAEQLDALRVARGRSGTSGRLPRKIVIDLPTAVGIDFAEQFSVRLVDATTAPWEYLFGMLEAFVAREGHARVPQVTSKMAWARRWVTNQRACTETGVSRQARVARLEALPGWSWDSNAEQWEDNFASLERSWHARATPECPQDHVEGGIQLGSGWVSQRGAYKKGRSSEHEIAPLGGAARMVVGCARGRNGKTCSRLLEQFVAREGHARVPAGHVEGDVPLGQWVKQPAWCLQEGAFVGSEGRAFGGAAGMVVGSDRGAMGETLRAARAVRGREGHARVPRDHIEGRRKARYLGGQPAAGYKKGRLSEGQIARLEALPGWSWDLGTDAMGKTCSRCSKRSSHARATPESLQAP